ncbi:MAG: hypothetical protein Q8P67_15395 [archaeon]|nr:hypothetical protein [archaeon]
MAKVDGSPPCPAKSLDAFENLAPRVYQFFSEIVMPTKTEGGILYFVFSFEQRKRTRKEWLLEQ